MLNRLETQTAESKEGTTMKSIWGLALMGLLIAPPGWAQAPSPAEQELVRLEHSWKQAVVNRDVSALKRLYAEEYVSTDQGGMVGQSR